MYIYIYLFNFHCRLIRFPSHLHVTGFGSWRITEMIHSCLVCVWCSFSNNTLEPSFRQTHPKNTCNIYIYIYMLSKPFSGKNKHNIYIYVKNKVLSIWGQHPKSRCRWSSSSSSHVAGWAKEILWVLFLRVPWKIYQLFLPGQTSLGNLSNSGVGDKCVILHCREITIHVRSFATHDVPDYPHDVPRSIPTKSTILPVKSPWWRISNHNAL